MIKAICLENIFLFFSQAFLGYLDQIDNKLDQEVNCTRKRKRGREIRLSNDLGIVFQFEPGVWCMPLNSVPSNSVSFLFQFAKLDFDFIQQLRRKLIVIDIEAKSNWCKECLFNFHLLDISYFLFQNVKCIQMVGTLQ